MSELPAFVAKFDSRLARGHQEEKVDFTLENGAAQLGKWFSSVKLYKQENSLRVTERSGEIKTRFICKKCARAT
ncbi:MAG: hypothetical protein B6243_11870 [Anaerolineaceae bacterium 4572_5.2]|nr:MAG: hypothetical protein B6243_11870 [Anaerolineaceae bacterium 4572_5.2]